MTIGRAPYNNKEEMWHTFTWGYEGSKGLVFINQPRIRVCLTSHSVVVVGKRYAMMIYKTCWMLN